MSNSIMTQQTPAMTQSQETPDPRRQFRMVRETLGMNQSDFAKAIGVSQGLVSLIESGRTPVSKKVSSKLREIAEKQEQPAA
jgi:DNA-binding XRE family transcriptional regulator